MRRCPLVSIVTPSFNQAQYLEQAIQSVLQQDYPNLEYMIIDGGSTDGSVETIKKYANRLAWWVSEKDSGQAEAINKGLRRARGEVVAWLNSDDLYLPAAILQAVTVLKQNPGIGLVYGDVLAIDENGQTINRLKYADWGLAGLMVFQIIGQPAVFMRRSVLAQAGYLDTSYHFLLDHHLWLRMARLAGTRYVPETWAAARFHTRAKNVARGAEMSKEAYRIAEWMRSQPDFAPVLAGRERHVWAGAHRFHAHYLLDGGQPAGALQVYWRSLLAHPPTALKEWRRILFAFLCLLGFEKLRSHYLRWRKSAASRTQSLRKK